MNNKEYLINYITQRVDEVGNQDYQCVAANKDHAKKVRGMTLGRFGGAAIKVTYKIGGTYDPRYVDKLKVGLDDLKEGDHVVQKFGSTGHIGRIRRADNKGYYLVGQNDGEYDKDRKEKRGNGDGVGNDAILIRYYYRDERPLAYIFRKKK